MYIPECIAWVLHSGVYPSLHTLGTPRLPAPRCSSLLHRVLTATSGVSGKRLWAQFSLLSLGRASLAGLSVTSCYIPTVTSA